MHTKEIVETKTTRTWILEIDEQEAAFLHTLCGMQTGDDIKSYRKIANAFYYATNNIDYTTCNKIRKLMTLHPAGEEFPGSASKISWANGLA